MTDRMRRLGASGNAIRDARAELRLALRRREMTILDVLDRPPACVRGKLLVDVLRWARGVGPSTLIALGRFALEEDINLCKPLEALRPGERVALCEWIAQHVVDRGRPAPLPELAAPGPTS